MNFQHSTFNTERSTARLPSVRSMFDDVGCSMFFPFRVLFLLGLATATALSAEPEPLSLWYTNPAANWSQALPIGNGKLAAMVFGGVAREQIQFNEDTIWIGQPHDYSHPGASNVLADIRRLTFDCQGAQAWRDFARSNFMSVPLRQCAWRGRCQGNALFL